MNLAALYHATSGGNWDDKGNWLSNAPIGKWHGVTTDSDGRVVELSLITNNLLGEIPPELGSLAKLERLNLCGNEIGEEIPPELGNLVHLKHLNLAYNNLSGQIPPELGRLANLEYLDVQNNQISGDIPMELGSLVGLRGVERSGTVCPSERKGFLPDFRGIWGTAPVGLNLSRNQLQGEIPPGLGNLVNLKHLDLSYNDLSGRIPPQLGNLSELRTLTINNNSLSGKIPSTLGNLSELRTLTVNNNTLSGEIPSKLGNLTNLKELELYHRRENYGWDLEAWFKSTTPPMNDFNGCVPAGLREVPVSDVPDHHFCKD